MTYPDLADRSPANFDDYDNYDDYGDYDGDVIAGVISMEEYHELDVRLSYVVPPQNDPDESSTERDPADLLPSMPCACTNPATECPLAPLRDTADVVCGDYVDNYDDYHYDCQYDDCPDYYDYDDFDDCGECHDYDDYGGCGDYGDCDGDVAVGVISIKEYKERDAILSDVVLP